MWVNQRNTTYDERYKFTGKERDEETGYDFFGARNYSSAITTWLSPDPLADKYPSISSYAYCNWNPLKYVDPDGRDTKDVIVGYTLGVLTSLVPGTSFLRDTYAPNSSMDYNTALANVDNASFVLGGGMTAAGVSGVGAGTVMAVAGGVTASSIAGAPEGAVIAASGGVVIVGSETLSMTGTILMANAVANKSNGYNRGKKSKNKNVSATNSTPSKKSEAEHTKNARPSTKNKHQEGQARKSQDKHGEKGDARRKRYK